MARVLSNMTERTAFAGEPCWICRRLERHPGGPRMMITIEGRRLPPLRLSTGFRQRG